ncbi:extracellular matrix organizing protein FRAS1-like [Uloborus diversus]|uniref:extracellular matrix organizing protein FRAS1-like n=1 Tax=Uloborus diversus TaxID=327109 RepID=UPI00240A6541|nr:extracellular matrix organizing protein FRAS1-like [Uloborus diversus]
MSWNSSCNFCNCHLDKVSCSKTECPFLSCESKEVPLLGIGDCCPKCSIFKKTCSEDSSHHIHGTVWSSDSNCILYQCQDGFSVPFVMECPSLVCSKDEFIYQLDNECCPRCISPACFNEGTTQILKAFDIKSDCFYSNTNISRQCALKSDHREVSNIFWKDPCTLCTSDYHNSMHCYSPKCPACGSQSVNFPYKMCCPCPKQSCAKGCVDCLTNRPDYCTVCESREQVIHNGKCIDNCPMGYFKNERNHCKSCSSSCKTCFGNMTTQCFSCKKGFYFQKGHCIQKCDINYYISGGNCTECHKSCESCTGPSENDCVSCALEGQLLQDGRCVDSCSGHFYVADNYCLPCNESCARCLKDGTCQYCEKNFYLEDGVCLQECSAGYYKYLDAYCLPCHEECQQCFGPLSFQCTSCPFTLYLLHNSCVWDCGQGYYGDLGAGVCRTCHPDCRACLGASNDKCLSCTDGYLLPYVGTHFGKCVQKCPARYFLSDFGTCEGSESFRHQKMKIQELKFNMQNIDSCYDIQRLQFGPCCGLISLEQSITKLEADVLSLKLSYHQADEYITGNTENPILTPRNILRLPVGGSIYISESFLNASDPDSDSLYILATEIPKNGFLLRVTSQGEEQILKPGDNFTSVELSDGQIFFKHISGIPLKGPLTLKVTDGFLIGNEINFEVQVTSDFPPQIIQLRNIIVFENAHVTINSSFIYLDDKDNIQDITLHVVQKPCYGSLILLPTDKEVDVVSHEDFLQNKFAFKSSKHSSIYEDNFIVQAFDGYNSKIIEVKLFILPQLNFPCNVDTKCCVDLLLVSVTSSIVQFLRSNSDENGNAFVLNSDVVGFTQDDIDNRRISVKYLENVASSMDLPFRVSNRNSNDEIDVLFKMHFLEPQLPIPNSLHPNEYGIMVLQNHPAIITPDHLRTESSGTFPDDVIYVIIRKLLKDEGVLENLDNPGHQLQSFTQQDVDKMKIVYHPPPYLDSIETQFIFQFFVIDAKRNARLSPLQNFTITVRPSSTDLTSPASSIDHEVTVLLSQGETVELGTNWLSTAGHEIPEDQLEVVLSNAPLHGMLIQKQNGVEIEIFEDDGFSFTSIINDAYYKHDGSDQLKDSAVFKVMGGPYSSLNKVNFIISRYDKESPVILDSTGLMGSVTAGEILDLHRYHLAYTDLISGDADIVFTLLNEPKYGKLERGETGIYRVLKSKDTFTQQDINDLLIRYNADIEIGDDTVRDFLYFDVADGSGNVQANQVLTMKVKPKIKEPPIVKVTADIQVDEGGGAVIEPHIITVFDPDSPLSDLVVVVERQPEYGYLENSKPIPGLELSLSGIPISVFPYIDLVEGYIKYIQLSHLGVEPEKDTILIHITDGHLLSETHLVNIIIKPVNDETPHLFTDTLTVHQGGYAKVLNSTIFVLDADTSPNNLLIQFNNLTRMGSLRKLRDNSYNFLHSRRFTEEDSFTFQDVLDGLVMYVHESASSSNDSFTITVSDGFHIDTSTVEIVIIVKDREAPFLLRNLGLELVSGNSSTITITNLHATDMDSPDESLIYTVTNGPTSGLLMLLKNDVLETVSTIEIDGVKRNQFTQMDINEGNLLFHHSISDPIGTHYFKFNIHDLANNALMDQTFFITISEDIFPPMITKNAGLTVPENKFACITPETLNAVDEHVKSSNIIFNVTSAPNLGFLQKKSHRNLQNFTMSDIFSGIVCYMHTAQTNEALDSFTFTVSDGKNHIPRNQYPELPPLAAITALIRLGIESYRDWMACTGTDTHAASKRCHSSSTVVAGVS